VEVDPIQQHNPPAGTVGLPLLVVPVLRPDIAQLLDTLPRHRTAAAAQGRLLYLPRLGITVLPHAPNPVAAGGGWVCTVAGAARADELPVGALVLSDLEIETAIATPNPDAPLDYVSTAEYAAIWSLRVHQWSGGGPALRLARELLELASDDLSVATMLQPAVAISSAATRSLARRVQVLPQALPQRIKQLEGSGFLVDLTPTQEDGARLRPGGPANGLVEDSTSATRRFVTTTQDPPPAPGRRDLINDAGRHA
jgi:hypothetical protein